MSTYLLMRKPKPLIRPLYLNSNNLTRVLQLSFINLTQTGCSNGICRYRGVDRIEVGVPTPSQYRKMLPHQEKLAKHPTQNQETIRKQESTSHAPEMTSQKEKKCSFAARAIALASACISLARSLLDGMEEVTSPRCRDCKEPLLLSDDRSLMAGTCLGPTSTRAARTRCVLFCLPLFFSHERVGEPETLATSGNVGRANEGTAFKDTAKELIASPADIISGASN
nr:hypothetical protein Iba_chr09aCG13320 [Ipomoea batatas]